MRAERKAHGFWSKEKFKHSKANTLFEKLYDLKQALEYAENTKWPCLSVHDLHSLEAQMQPYVRKLNAIAEREHKEVQNQSQMTSKVEEIPVMQMRR